MTPDQMIAFIAALTAAEPVQDGFATLRAGGVDPRYPVTVAPCPPPVGAFEIEGRTLICGTVEVPEAHGDPDGRRIALSFTVLKSHSLTPAPDPLVYLHGGPGAGTVAAMRFTAQLFEAWRGRRDVVTFDQRAAGISDAAVTCLGTVAENLVGIVRAETGEGDEMALFGAMTAPCVAEIKASGIDLANFNTAENARDVRALVSALGYGDYNIYGASYGTMLAQEVMRSVPEGVRSVVLDSVAPTDVPLYDTLAGPFDAATVAIFDQCAADPACAAAYPDLLPRFNALLEKLKAEPIPAARGRLAITPEILFALIDARNKVTTPAITGLVPKMIAELEKGETGTFDLISGEGFGEASLDTTIAGTHAGLAPEAAALAEIALRLADQRRGLDAALDAAVTQLKAELEAGRSGTTLPGTFDAALGAAILETTTGAQRAAFVRDYAALALVQPSRAALMALVERHFLYRTRDRLAALIAAMSDAEVAAAFARVRSDTGPYEAAFSGMFDLDIYFCQEFRPFNSLEGARAFNATLSVPEWGRQVEAMLEQFFGFCDAFEPQPREGFHEPVVSDLPVLVLSGLNDVQTSWTWGPHVAESLTNARSFVFPEAGHGALLFSQCAVDLGVAFVEDPGQALDASCIEDLRPEFELP